MEELGYVVFEGINGCGKGSQISKFENLIYDSSRDVFASRIRTPNKLCDGGARARALLKSDGDPYENGLKAVSSFGDNHRTTGLHIDTLIDMGHFVMGDRNYLSTFAFQGAQGISYEEIAKGVRGAKVPDLTFLIDVPAEVADERLNGRQDGEGRRKFDSDLCFMGKVRENYLELPEVLPRLLGDRSIIVVDGVGTRDEVFGRVKEAYEDFRK